MGMILPWENLGVLSDIVSNGTLTSYSTTIGLYRASLHGQCVYIGKVTEVNNGGFKKRLRDYTRESCSARNYNSGMLMFKHKRDIEIEVLVFPMAGELPSHDLRTETTSQIEDMKKKLVDELSPLWNVTNKGREE